MEQAQVDKMIEQSRETKQPAGAESATDAHITIDEFAKVDLRVARIASAEAVEGADKLLRLTLDIGDETRQVFAGIKAAYDPAELEGRLVVAVANLQPRRCASALPRAWCLRPGPAAVTYFCYPWTPAPYRG